MISVGAGADAAPLEAIVGVAPRAASFVDTARWAALLPAASRLKFAFPEYKQALRLTV